MKKNRVIYIILLSAVAVLAVLFCTVHIYGSETVNPTAYAEGYTKYRCRICGKTYYGEYTTRENYALPNVVINEICADNRSAQVFPDGGYYPFIELYNPTDRTIDIDGFGLSDDENEPYKYKFSSLKLAPGELRAVAACAKVTGYELFTGFDISPYGGKIFLTVPGGTKADEAEYPYIAYNSSYAMVPDGSGKFDIMIPTLEKSNNDAGKFYFVYNPEFSHESGFFDSAFSLSISSSQGNDIYYTLDGSTPTKNSRKYTGSINISEKGTNATVIRAVCYDKDGLSSEVVTKTYFVGRAPKQSAEDIAVVSVAADAADLYDSRSGIFGNGGTSKKPKVHIDYFNSENKLGFGQEAGISAYNYESGTPLKSMIVFAGTEYDGKSKFNYEMIPGVEKMASFILSSGGYDSVSKIRDSIVCSAAAESSLSSSGESPCIVFINGIYNGVFSIKEPYDTDFIENHYGIPKSNAVVVTDGRVTSGDEKNIEMYTYVMKGLSYDMKIPENYASICRFFDIDSVIDFFAFQLYCGNTDWYNKNVSMWRSISQGVGEYEDCKWRFFIGNTDTSAALFEKSAYDFNSFEEMMNMDNFGETLKILSSLLKNSEFKNRFAIRFLDIANNTFDYGRVSKIISGLEKEYEKYMGNYYRQILGPGFSSGSFYAENKKIDEFYKNRRDYILGFFGSAFNDSGEKISVTLSENIAGAGSVTFNSGEYALNGNAKSFSYYSGYAYSLKAAAKDGYIFSHWILENAKTKNSTNSREITIVPDGTDVKITANYTKK